MRGVFPCVLLCVALAGQLVRADALGDQRDALARMGYAAELRVINELIGKSACYAMTGVAAEENTAEVNAAATRFSHLLTVLKTGDENAVQSAETDDKILQSLAEISIPWSSYGPAGQQIAQGDLHPFVLTQVMQIGPQLLDQLVGLSQQVADVHGARLVTKRERLNTVDLAVSQAMLAMQLGKSYCFFAIDVQREDMRASLETAKARFSIAAKAMANGDYDLGVIDPPNLKALMIMQQVEEVWARAQETMRAGLETPTSARDSLPGLEADLAQLHDLSFQMVDIYLE